MDSLQLTILSPERRLLEKATVSSVTLTGAKGQMQILPGHAAMTGILGTGVIRFQVASEPETVGVVSTGFFEVVDNQVTVTAETIELKGEISLQRAVQAQKKAEAGLNDASLDPASFKKYQLKLERALIRQQVSAGTNI